MTLSGTVDETPVVVVVIVEAELAGVDATPSLAGDAAVELLEVRLGDDPEDIVGFDEVPEAATDLPFELAPFAVAEPIAAPLTRTPLVTAGVAAELTEESTVRCGFAVNEGGMYCPVG